MCGRISQYRLPAHYAQRLHLKNPFVLVDAADRRPGYNLSPSTHPDSHRRLVRGRIEPHPGEPASKPYKQKQPCYIQRAAGEPMFLAALTSIMREEDAVAPGTGFVIVTSSADEGLVDVHDRRPLVFSRVTAKRWLDPAATGDGSGQTGEDRRRAGRAFRLASRVHRCEPRDQRRTASDRTAGNAALNHCVDTQISDRGARTRRR